MIRTDITYNDYCQSCGRNMGIVLNYRVYNDKIKSNDCKLISLCEDCSNSVTHLHFNCIKSERSYKYQDDEISNI